MSPLSLTSTAAGESRCNSSCSASDCRLAGDFSTLGGGSIPVRADANEAGVTIWGRCAWTLPSRTRTLFTLSINSLIKW